MTEKTLQPRKWIGKKKDGEILRFQEFMTVKNLNPEDIQRDTGVSVRTITNSIYENNPLGAKLLRQVHAKYGVSIDWILSGAGSMFVGDAPTVREPSSQYNVDNDRLLRIMGALDEWIKHASEDEKVWLEVDIKQRLILNWPPLGKHHG
ncbi:helix-turn-helix domain-containing protein [Methylophaga sp. OBS4]|uniref:helix-turn-helix domain-containing protein n=1 Tax=Methylophaga sp. OBS4 TaxID=2991935 RepID=UPI00225903B1|nr:helix-turn-helix transcriptional regulator [Methylophaga sp. OBS4]MCX4187193.1 helix-turn-helix domain-containing protein [Methylophaga sp. OBS4]